SARSPWVPREVAAAIDVHGMEGLCIVQTAGILPWTDGVNTGEFLQRPDQAISPFIYDLFIKDDLQPLVVDLRPYRDLPEKERARNPEYLSRIASIAAKALGKDKEVLWGEYYRAQKLRAAFLTLVSIALTSLVVALGIAVQLERRATRQATQQTQIAENNRQEA